MAMRIKQVLYSLVASCALAGALHVPARAAGLNIETATIADLNAAFADGTLTSEQLASAYLKRIEAYDKQGPAINAIITLNKKALDEARQLDAERKSGKVRGPLHGIPVVVKDNYDTVDMPTTAGSLSRLPVARACCLPLEPAAAGLRNHRRPPCPPA